MSLSDICIKRPVFATVLSLIIILFGIAGYSKLQIRATPKIDIPVIQVNAYYSGSSASYMEEIITRPIEKRLRSIQNVDFITSSSGSGYSNININFYLDSDLNQALSDIRSIISEMSYTFPKDMQLPSVSKQSVDGFPSIWMSVTSDRHNNMELTEVIENEIVPELNRIPTVGNATIFGGRDYTLTIEPDLKKLYAYKINPEEIRNAIDSQNRNYPAGSLTTDVKNFAFQLKTQISDIKDFEDIIIRNTKFGPIKLGNIANITLAPQDKKGILKYNGNSSIAIGIIKQSDANVVSLSDDVNKKFDKIVKSLPKGVKLKIAHDSAVPIKQSIYSVFRTIAEALILVGLVTYLFLGSLRSSIIPFIAIPISLIASFGFMKMLGFSINIFTLLALVLAIGLVVDDAIVVLENVYRYMDMGLNRFDASVRAIKEIKFAVIAMTLTLCAVYLPIGFLDGFLGKLFIEFAWTLAIAVLVSGFVALTLTPMMCSKIIEHHDIKKAPKFVQKFNELFDIIQEKYIKYLEFLIANKKVFYSILLVIFVCLVFGFKFVKKTFAPIEDDGYLFFNFVAPEGTTLDNSEKIIDKASKIIMNNDSISGNFMISNGDSGFGFVSLKTWEERKFHQEVIKKQLNTDLRNISDAMAFVNTPPSMLSGPIKKVIEFNLQIPGNNIRALDEMSQKFMERMKKNKIFENVERDYRPSTPMLDVVLNKEKAFNYGVSIPTLANSLQYLYTGVKVSDFESKKTGNYYDVILRLNNQDRNTISSTDRVFVKSTQGDKVINIDTIADIKEETTVKSYNHYNTLRQIQISADLNKGHTLNDAYLEIEKMNEELLSESNIKMEVLGDMKRMNQASGGMGIVFLLGLIFIYLVLAAQFESFKDPLIILVSVPFSILGALLLLIITGNTLNLYSNIGLITLIGLITKNSIMIVEFTNQLRETGVALKEALIRACSMRLRPILMTTMATVLGAVPLSISSGAGAEAKKSIGMCIVGGMSLGTLFTLFIIPVIYLIFKSDKNKSDKKNLDNKKNVGINEAIKFS